MREIVAKWLNGPGKLLGYRAMQNKIRQKHELKVPRELAYAVMYDLDPEGLEGRAPMERRKLSQKVIILRKAVTGFTHLMDI